VGWFLGVGMDFWSFKDEGGVFILGFWLLGFGWKAGKSE
jgi:hypothetical protein